MRDLDWYIQTARANKGFKSDSKLALALNLTNISIWRTGKSLPSEESMLKLARWAGVPDEIALCDLHVWINEQNHPVVADAYVRMREALSRVSGFAATLMLAAILTFTGFDGDGSAQAKIATYGQQNAPIYTLCDLYYYFNQSLRI